MKHYKQALFLALFSALTLYLPAQNLLISIPSADTLVVCGTDTFLVKIQNNNAVPMSGAALTVTLPQGISYFGGSVQGANQQNVSNLSAPVFGMADLGPGQSITVSMVLSANCDAADLLDAMQVFVANISLSSPLGNTQISTTLKVETGSLLIQSVTPQTLMGEIGDTVKRVICVQNTRIGKIGTLHFDDTHLAGFSASISSSNNQSNTPTFFSADFDNSLFQSVGNGDQWLDQFESVCFTEEIVITSCGIPAFANPSILRAGWGCGGDICRYDTFTLPNAQVTVQIKTSTKIPDLVFEQIWSPPTDYCGNTPAVMGYKIKNQGHADATDIVFNLSLTEGLTEAAMNIGSFRLESSIGSTPILPNASTPTFLPACNRTEIREGNFLIPLVQAGDSIQFLFDVITCVEQCEGVQPSFRVDYFYKKDCPANGFVSGNKLLLPEDGYTVKGTVVSNIGVCMESGQPYPFVYEAVSKYLSEDGFWHLEMELPFGITLDTACGLTLGGQAPSLFESDTIAGGGDLVHLAWATPFASDSVAMSFCLRFDCDTNIVCLGLEDLFGTGVIYTDYCCFLPMKDATYWAPALNTARECAINDCHERVLAVNAGCLPGDGAPGDSTGIDPIIPVPGLTEWWKVYRLNLGYQDSNDDRKAELPLSQDGSIANRLRFLAGDTLRVEYCAVMEEPTTVDTITRAIWHEIVGGDMGANGNDLFMTSSAQNSFADSSKFRWLGNRIRVRYADGTEAFCDWGGMTYADDRNYFQVVNPNSFPPQPIDDIATEKFHFLFSLPEMFANGCLPKPELTLGDSIFILSDFKIDLNFKPTSSNNPDPPLVGFRTASSSGGLKYAWNLQPREYLQYSGWKKYRTPNTHNIKPCETSLEVSKYRYSIRIARENMFPFEVRPLAWISDYKQTIPSGLELASAKLEYLALQDSVPWLTDINLPFSQPPGFLDIDFAPAFLEPIDEGFTLRSALRFKPNCHFVQSDTSMQFIETSFVGCLNGNQMTALDSIKNAIGFYSSIPKIGLLTTDSILYAPSRDFEINFILKNLLAPGSPSAWVAILSPSGQASDFELYRMPQNQLISGTSDLYNLGSINNPLSLRLKGQNHSCDVDTLMILYGWSCTPISSLSETDCSRDTFFIELHQERPELELEVIQEPASLTLCDTSDWFEFEIYNSNIGFAYDLKASVKLPQGLNIVPGTAQIAYPVGAPWTGIADPAALPGNLYLWETNSILPTIASTGLPGINLSPQNTFRIRFKAIAECGFVSNSPAIYGASGKEPCGRQSNSLNKPGDLLTVLGLTPTYGVQIGLLPVGSQSATCGAQQEFSVNLSILGTPAPGDSVYVVLPQGVTYVPGSYVPGQNAPQGPVMSNLSGFQIALPILQGGGIMQFNFKVAFGSTSGCEDLVLQVQTRVQTQAFCQSLGAPCEVFISTGEALWQLNIEHPQLIAGNPTFFIQNNQVNGAITVTNVGTIASNGALVQLWRDIDGDGTVSVGDLLLQTLQTPSQILPGESVLLSEVIPGLDSAQFCDLLILLPGTENCICDDQLLNLENPKIRHTPMQFCAVSPVQIGIQGQSGFDYQWQPAAWVDCPTCPSALFTPVPGTPLNTVQTLTLIESADSCTVTHTFEISFGAGVAQITGDSAICKGEAITLSASPAGTAYLWQGPGIQNPNQAAHNVQVNSSSTYMVTVTLANGCTAIDSIRIAVALADTVQLAAKTTCAGEPVDVLGTLTAMPGTYYRSYLNAAGCDSTELQILTVLPEPATEETLVFCAGGSLMVYDTLFTSSGSVFRVFSAFNGCDSIHVVNVLEKDPPVLVPVDTIFGTFGQIITLSGPNGFETYIWQPAPVPPCLNCPVVTYPADSTGYQEYLLQVADSNGCPGELVFRVFIFPPCSADSLRIPNAFTPNGDGKNDVFRVVEHEGAEVVSSLEIYDRWGVKVFEGQGDAFWDGSIDGQPAPSDVYVYIIKVHCGELVGKRVGDVTLLR